jgi:hypothetical protein
MKIISHRGNLNGPDPENENKYSYIQSCLDLGFDVEIDIWAIDGQLYLGHDKPQYAIDKPSVASIGLNGWFHCKNLGALEYFKDNFNSLNYFWHQSDDYTITSSGYFWTYPGKLIGEQSIIVLPETIEGSEVVKMLAAKPYGVCTDYPKQYRKAGH